MKPVERGLRVKCLHLARPADHIQEDHGFGLRLEMRPPGRERVEEFSIFPAALRLRIAREQIRKRERAEAVGGAGEKIAARSGEWEMRFNDLHGIPLYRRNSGDTLESLTTVRQLSSRARTVEY